MQKFRSRFRYRKLKNKTISEVLVEILARADHLVKIRKISRRKANDVVWYIVSFLRGPDNHNSDYIKTNFTAPFRYLLGLAKCSPHGVVIKKPLIHYSMIEYNVKNLMSDHYREHYANAYEALIILRYIKE